MKLGLLLICIWNLTPSQAQTSKKRNRADTDSPTAKVQEKSCRDQFTEEAAKRYSSFLKGVKNSNELKERMMHLSGKSEFVPGYATKDQARLSFPNQAKDPSCYKKFVQSFPVTSNMIRAVGNSTDTIYSINDHYDAKEEVVMGLLGNNWFDRDQTYAVFAASFFTAQDVFKNPSQLATTLKKSPPELAADMKTSSCPAIDNVMLELKEFSYSSYGRAVRSLAGTDKIDAEVRLNQASANDESCQRIIERGLGHLVKETISSTSSCEYVKQESFKMDLDRVCGKDYSGATSDFVCMATVTCKRPDSTRFETEILCKGACESQSAGNCALESTFEPKQGHKKISLPEGGSGSDANLGK